LAPPDGSDRFAFTLNATGVHSVMWSNANGECRGTQGACPDGAGAWKETVRLPTGDRVVATNAPYSELRATGGSLVARGQAVAIGAGGRNFNQAIQGSMRLPVASRADPCQRAPCFSPGNKTVSLEGAILLANVSYAAGTRLHSSLAGNLDAARLDELQISPLTLFGSVVPVAVGAATLALGYVLFRVVFGLFSRQLTPEDALLHPKRRRLLEAVQAHPGSAYRDLMAVTGFSDGVVRNHLKALARVGLVVAQESAGSLLYFENHGRYSRTWQAVVAHRDPNLRQLLLLVRDHPNQTQQQVVERARGAGLTRSATQRRLGRLEAWGLIRVHLEGRVRRYQVNPFLEGLGPNGETLDGGSGMPP
jgi:predicted transcriptional regulator